MDLGSTGLWRSLLAFGEEEGQQDHSWASPKRGLGPDRVGLIVVQLFGSRK